MVLKKKVLSLLAAGALSVGVVGPAAAVVVDAEGGKWDYGNANGIVWSHYYHGSQCHGSSVVGNIRVNSGNTRPGVWARASAESRWWASDKSYYRKC